MATYTDLKNRVKETLNVDYNDRATNQEVHFTNEYNTYKGQFKGKIDATNSSVTGGTISGVTILCANLTEDIVLPGNIRIDKIGTSIKQISAAVDALEEKHDDDKVELTGSIALEAERRESADLSIRTDMYHMNVALTGLISAEQSHREFFDSELCTMIVDERNDRLSTDSIMYSNDRVLSNAILSVDSDLHSEIGQRIREIDRVDGRIDNSVSASEQYYLSALSALSAHAERNDKQFAELSDNLTLDIEHDKHYTIYKEGITQCYPYKMKDFAVNILQIDTASGYAMRNGKVIGKIETGDPNTLYPLTLEVFKFDDPDLDKAIEPNTYTFTETQQRLRAKGRYDIVFYPSASGLSNSYFSLIPKNGKYLPVYYKGRVIGEIRDYQKSYDDSRLISGYITLNPTSLDMRVFESFYDVKFNNSNLSCINIGTQRMIFNRISQFDMYKNITKHEYCQLTDLSNVNFGCIYKENGILSDDFGIKRIVAKITDPVVELTGKYVSLDLSNNFTDVLCANTIVSCDIEHQAFDIVEKHELYKYNFYLSDDILHEKGEKGFVVPAKENVELASYDYHYLSVDMSQVVKIDAFKKMFKLEYNSYNDNWKVSETSLSNDVIDIWFDRKYIYVYAQNGTTGMHVDGKFAVDSFDKTIYNTESCHKHLHKTSHVDFIFDKVEEWNDGIYSCVASLIDKSDDLPTYDLNIDTTNADIVKIELPTKKFNDISRELKIVLRLNSIANKLVKVVFVDEIGNPVVFFNNRKNELLVKTNTYTTYQLNEIANGIYHLYDYDNNELWRYIAQLSGEVKDISVELSTDYTQKIDTLREDLELSVENIEKQTTSNAKNITLLSTDVAEIYSRIKGGINYKGVVNVIDKYCEHGRENFHISNLFFIDFGSSTEHHDYKQPDPTYVPDTILSNGFMYIAKKTADNLSSQWIVDGVQIDAGDYVIINCREGLIPGAECKAIKDLTSADIDVIDAQDDNVVTNEVLRAVSSLLSNEINSTNAKIDLSVRNLQNQIDSNDTDISALSGEISATNAKIDLSVDNLQQQIISNDTDISVLEDKVSFLLSVDRETVNYKGILPQYRPEYADDPTAWQLYELLMPNIAMSGLFDVKLGDLFKVNQALSAIYDYRKTEYVSFGKLDFFIANKNVKNIRDIKVSDIDIFRNPEVEIEILSSNLQRQIDKNVSDIHFLSYEISATNAKIDLSVDNLQQQIISNDTDISDLSAKVEHEIVRNADHVALFGNVELSTDYDVPGKTGSAYNKLFGLIYTNLSVTGNPSKRIKKGTLFRAVGNTSASYDTTDTETTRILHNNDFIMFNKTVDEISNVTYFDVDIINDYDLSVRNLQNQIISNDIDINFLSDEISATNEKIDLSVRNLQNQIISNDTDINFLSDEISATNEKIDLSVDNLQQQIISNDTDINSLSTKQQTISSDLIDLQNHYNKTFVEDTYVKGPDKNVDVLKVTDSENTNNKFKLIYLSGTLVLETL